MSEGMDCFEGQISECEKYRRLAAELREETEDMAAAWDAVEERFEVLCEVFKRERLRCTRALMANLHIDANEAVELLDFDEETRHTLLNELRRDA